MTETVSTSNLESVKELGQRLSNWGRWGDDDEAGTLNFITPETRVAAARLVVTGRVFDLGMPFDQNGPFSRAGMGRFNPIHLMSVTAVDPRTDDVITSDDVIIMPLQCATHWDGLAHAGYDGFFYNGAPASAVTARHGATRVSFAGLNDRFTARGVLLDIPRLKGVDALEAGFPITADDLTAAEELGNVKVRSGDILLLRTGWYQHFAAGDHERFHGSAPGVDISTLEWLYEREVAAIASDNWAVEVMPSTVEGVGVPFHRVAMRDMGLTLGEMFNLEELAEDCAADGVYEFFFSGTGLKISNSVASPVTPLAIK
jgi:kynurenine formamidase